MLFNRNINVERVLSTYCVRSAFDLYLQARKFEKGSEIVFTAMNIPDMTRIATENGLKIVPLEINPSTFNIISFEAFEKVITPKTKAVVFAHLFGVHIDLDPYAGYLRKRGIDVIEDCAQGFWGADVFNGNPQSTITMFSFGFIKI